MRSGSMVRCVCLGAELEHPAELYMSKYLALSVLSCPQRRCCHSDHSDLFYNPKWYLPTPAGQYERFCP